MKPNPIPATPGGWLVEIAAAYNDAAEAIPFGQMSGQPFGESELFHLAPIVAMKFRGLRRSRSKLTTATEAALASYVANHDDNAAVLEKPYLAFAFCYLAAHYGLGLLGETEAEQIMEYADSNRRRLARLAAGEEA